LRASHIIFEKVTVTGTENIMMAAVLADGKTILENVAREPEVVDLANYLNEMGARIEGAGTNRIEIEGVKSLKPSVHTVIPDRIEAATFMIAAAITGGEIIINNAPIKYLKTFLSHLKESGVSVRMEDKGFKVKGTEKLSSVDVITAPYPGFATDIQAQFMALMTIADGISIIKETIFENRFMHVPELNRLGANIKIDGSMAIVKGCKKLRGAPVQATDLRASASLVLAGLAAEGITKVSRIYHLERGYEKLDEKLSTLGAKILRIPDKLP